LVCAHGERVSTYNPACDSHLPNVDDSKDSAKVSGAQPEAIVFFAAESSRIVHISEGW